VNFWISPFRRIIMFKFIRIFILMVILLLVAQNAWHEKVLTLQWEYTLPVNIYPINGDGSEAAKHYISTLSTKDFLEIENFMKQEAKRFGQSINDPIEVRLHPEVDSLPPHLPEEQTKLSTLWWSLKMRWWSFWNTKTQGSGGQIKLFLIYFDPVIHPNLSHSTALEKGLIGRINVFADRTMTRKNAVIITHEFLHTLGATDKYDLATNQPIFPGGYATPQLKPLFPQSFAEIMAGRIPVSENEAEIPSTLHQVLMGYETAKEIGWVKN
jgi:hypothetical protein